MVRREDKLKTGAGDTLFFTISLESTVGVAEPEDPAPIREAAVVWEAVSFSRVISTSISCRYAATSGRAGG